MQTNDQFPRNLNEGHLQFLDLILKKLRLLKNWRVRAQLQFYMTTQSERSFSGAEFYNTSAKKSKPLFEVLF